MNQAGVDRYDEKMMAPAMRGLYENSDFYNVGEWASEPPLLATACQRLIKKHCVPLPKGKRPLILDAGCGLGAGTALIGKHYENADIIGINISIKQIQYARRKHASASVAFQPMDAAHLEFPRDVFDLIISVEAAFHFDTRHDFIASAFRVLKPGGSLVFTDVLFFDTKMVGSWCVPSLNRIIDIAAHEKICASPGFVVVEHEDITTQTWTGFCEYLRRNAGRAEFANELAPTVASYLFTHLIKPQ